MTLPKVSNIFVNRSSSSDYCMSVLNGTGSMENCTDNKVFIQPMSKDNRENNSSPMEMDSRSSSISSGNSRDPIYKFKHSITKRFSQQKSGSNPSDSSSSSSRDDESDQYKWFGTSSITDSISSRSSTSNCRKGEFQTYQMSRRYREDKFNGPSSMLPAFVLHPSGTHYIPVKITTASVDEIFPDSPVPMSGTFHPINIPVCFDRPCFLIQNVNAMCNNSSENGESGYSTQIKSANNWWRMPITIEMVPVVCFNASEGSYFCERDFHNMHYIEIFRVGTPNIDNKMLIMSFKWIYIQYLLSMTAVSKRWT